MESTNLCEMTLLFVFFPSSFWQTGHPCFEKLQTYYHKFTFLVFCVSIAIFANLIILCNDDVTSFPHLSPSILFVLM